MLNELESMVQKDFKGPGPYPAHYTLPASSSGPFAHPKPSTSNIPTAIPSFGPGAPPSPPSTTSPVTPEKSSRRSSVDSYPTPTDVPHLPTPPASHSNVPSPENSTPPVTPPNYQGDSAKIVSSVGFNTMQIPGNNGKSSSLIPAHTKAHIPIDTKHTSPKKTSSAHRHTTPVKSNSVPVRSSMHVVNWSPLSYHYSICCSSPTTTVLAYSIFVPRRRDPLLL